MVPVTALQPICMNENDPFYVLYQLNEAPALDHREIMLSLLLNAALNSSASNRLPQSNQKQV